jgi:hypothetical protein
MYTDLPVSRAPVTVMVNTGVRLQSAGRSRWQTRQISWEVCMPQRRHSTYDGSCLVSVLRTIRYTGGTR